MPLVPPPKFKGKNGRPLQITIDEFKKGTITLVDVGRLPIDAVTYSQNMMQGQDGVWKPRHGTKNYGESLTSTPSGMYAAVVYNTDGTNTNYLFTMDNGTLKYCKDGGAWTAITGKTWNTAATQTVMLQVQGLLYITNSLDDLSFVDLSNMTVTTYTALGQPGTLTGVASSSLAATPTNYNVYYTITAVNAVGETAASMYVNGAYSSAGEITIAVNNTRSNWTKGTDYTTLGWAAVTGAVSYNIYYSSLYEQEVYIDSTTATSYVDYGQTTPNPFQIAPSTDGTAGPPFSLVRWSDNRMWFTGVTTHPYRVYFSATGVNLTSLNPGYGGGWFDLNLGGDEKVMDVQHYRSGTGTQMAVIFTTSPKGGGSVWFCQLGTQTAGNITATVPSLLSQHTVGTTSIRGAVMAANNVFYPSILGFQSIGSAPNIINVISTTDVSAVIRPTVQGVIQSYADSICGIYFYGRIYWSVPFGTTENNQIWILDLERQCWTIAWDIGVTQFETYTDNLGKLHLLGIPTGGTNIIEFSKSYTNDNGTPFTTDIQSGLIYGDPYHFGFDWIQYAYVELGRPEGEITFNIYGSRPNSPNKLIGSLTFSGSEYVADGLGFDKLGSIPLGQTGGTPSTVQAESIKKVISVNSILNYWQWEITSSDPSQHYDILELGFIGMPVSIGPPATWRS